MTDSSNSTLNMSTKTDDISAYQAPVQSAPQPAAQSNPQSADSATTTVDSESLEAQNIFELLGVNNGTDSDKEVFLDELQQVIWQDFLDSDLQLLLTKDELAKVKEMQAKNSDISKQQEEIVGFLENLIPDLEDIMLEKALELKREMVQERIIGLKGYLAGQTEKLALLDAAEILLKQNKWASATAVLNKL